MEWILAYADDLSVICDSVEQVRQVIKVVENWGNKAGLKLNKGKSGIL